MNEHADTSALVAYVMLSHRAPAQVIRLVERLVGERCYVFLHVDASAPAAVYDPLRAALAGHERVRLLNRNPVRWSGWGTVQAMHTGFHAVLESPEPFTHVVVCSGQDYPLRPAPRVADFFDAELGCSFVAHMKLPSPMFGQNGGMDRLTRWHRPVGRRRLALPLLRRRYPPMLKPIGGSSWYCLSREAASYVVDFGRRHPEVIRFHQRIWAPDEHYVQSVVLSAEGIGPVFSENLWHIEWTGSRAKHPDLLGSEALPRLRGAARGESSAGGPSRAKLWARKFDLEADPAVLASIDAELLGG